MNTQERPSDLVRRIRTKLRARGCKDWAGAIAGIVGAHVETVYSWKTGTSRPNPENLAKLQKLNHDLTFGADPGDPSQRKLS